MDNKAEIVELINKLIGLLPAAPEFDVHHENLSELMAVVEGDDEKEAG